MNTHPTVDLRDLQRGLAKDAVTKKDTEARALIYDSLQVAHKCILNSFMSRQLEDYGDQKGISQTTAKVEFLGAKIMKDKGLSCKFVIAVVSRMAIRKEKKIEIWKFKEKRKRK